MGLFDTVTISGLFCYHCGAPAGEEWQTKDGDCLLDSYTLEEFFTKNHDVYTASFSGDCTLCNAWLRIGLPNETEASRLYQDFERKKWESRYRSEAAAEHPNHKGYEVWCEKCKSDPGAG